MILQQFDFEVKHISGKSNAVADALSRAYEDELQAESRACTPEDLRRAEAESFVIFKSYGNDQDETWYPTTAQRKQEQQEAQAPQPGFEKTVPDWLTNSQNNPGKSEGKEEAAVRIAAADGVGEAVPRIPTARSSSSAQEENEGLGTSAGTAAREAGGDMMESSGNSAELRPSGECVGNYATEATGEAEGDMMESSENSAEPRPSGEYVGIAAMKAVDSAGGDTMKSSENSAERCTSSASSMARTAAWTAGLQGGIGEADPMTPPSYGKSGTTSVAAYGSTTGKGEEGAVSQSSSLSRGGIRVRNFRHRRRFWKQFSATVAKHDKTEPEH